MVRILSIIIILSFLEESCTLFPKIVWSYVPSAEEMSTLEHLCIDNLHRFAD
jgi:hypothetical protein